MKSKTNRWNEMKQSSQRNMHKIAKLKKCLSSENPEDYSNRKNKNAKIPESDMDNYWCGYYFGKDKIKKSLS